MFQRKKKNNKQVKEQKITNRTTKYWWRTLQEDHARFSRARGCPRNHMYAPDKSPKLP